MKITSKAFQENKLIPVRYTGYGEDISPDFTIVDLPENTVSIAITMDDLDIPFFSCLNHWVAWNIEKKTYLEEGLNNAKEAIQGRAYGKNRYAGPKIPAFFGKPHRYLFTIYALSIRPKLTKKKRKTDLLREIAGSILDSGSITGLCYNKKIMKKM